MKSLFKLAIITTMSLLAACSSIFNDTLFSLIPHPQEPEERPYAVKKVSFINSVDQTRIVGEITYPNNGSNFRAIVLVSGHTLSLPPTTRNNEITGHKYFLVLSHLLTMRGYLVLRYDNRGVGESSGSYLNATDDDFASDAAAALQWLRYQSNIKITSSGFLGHSQGAIKSLIAAETENPDFIVSLAGVGIQTVAELILQQNFDISQTTEQNEELKEIFQLIRSAKSRDEAAKSIRQYALTAGVKDEGKLQILVENYASNWMYNELDRDIKILLKNYQNPVLALFGTKDRLVSAKVNDAPTRLLISNPHSEVYTFIDKNHLFQNAKNGTGSEEYWEIETTIEDGVIEKIDLWLQSLENPT